MRPSFARFTRFLHWCTRVRSPLVLLFLGLLLPLALFGAVAAAVLAQKPRAFDCPILLLMHQHAMPPASVLNTVSTDSGAVVESHALKLQKEIL